MRQKIIYSISVLFLSMSGVVCMEEADDSSEDTEFPLNVHKVGHHLEIIADENTDQLPQGEKRKLSIVLVEDSDCMGKIEVRMLTDLGHDVEWVTNGEDAIKRANKSPKPEVIIFDQNLGTGLLTGTEAATKIHHQYPGIFLIGVTTDADNEEYKRLSTSAGMLAIIKKPVGSQDFKEILEDITGIQNSN